MHGFGLARRHGAALVAVGHRQSRRRQDVDETHLLAIVGRLNGDRRIGGRADVGAQMDPCRRRC